MGNELGSAGKVVTEDLGGGFHNFKDTVYHFLGNSFGWLSAHPGVALIIILCVSAAVIWYILRVRKYRKQLEQKVTRKSVEIDKKDVLINEQKSTLEVLQKKMSDQQEFISEALLGTMATITGYDIDQLPIFFKFLTKIDGNPLQMADAQVDAMPKGLELEEKSDDTIEENDTEEKISMGPDPGEVGAPNKNGEELQPKFGGDHGNGPS